MFETFSHSYIRPNEKVEPHILHNLEEAQDSYKLWFVRRLGWPLQQIPFHAIVSTPRKLSSLETILLHIHQVMQVDPPDTTTIARELAIQDSFFIDQIVSELSMLGALQAGSEGQIRITDLGCECYNRGEMPSQARQQDFSILFDPVAHEFPDSPIVFDSDNSCAEDVTVQSIDPAFQPADPNRIDLETLRQVAAAQGMLSNESDSVIFTAEPVEVQDNGQAAAGISFREVYLLLLLDNQGQINLRVYDQKSKATTKWFQKVIDARLSKGHIDLSYLVGSLKAAVGTPYCTDTTGQILFDGNFISLSRIPAHTVHKKILATVAEAKRRLFMRARGLGDNTYSIHLSEAIENAAERGVRCHLLWDAHLKASGTQIHSNIPTHDNIEHRLASKREQELLIADENIVLAPSVSHIAPPAGEPKTYVLTVGESKNRSAGQKLGQAFLTKWQSGQPFELAGLLPALPAKSILGDDSKQIIKVVDEPFRVDIDTVNALQTRREAS